jgi:hypothetical protein
VLKGNEMTRDLRVLPLVDLIDWGFTPIWQYFSHITAMGSAFGGARLLMYKTHSG